MATLTSFLTSSLLWCSLIKTSLSLPPPAKHAQNLSTDILSNRRVLFSLNAIPSLNLTSPVHYVVPDTQITMFFYLGFRIDPVAMRDTIDAARNYCELQIERSGDVILPPTEDPFDDDLGYGAAIHVVSTRPKHRITWGILRGIMQGLWGFLVMQEKYLEAEFHVRYAGIGSIGQGTITEAVPDPGHTLFQE